MERNNRGKDVDLTLNCKNAIKTEIVQFKILYFDWLKT